MDIQYYVLKHWHSNNKINPRQSSQTNPGKQTSQ